MRRQYCNFHVCFFYSVIQIQTVHQVHSSLHLQQYLMKMIIQMKRITDLTVLGQKMSCLLR